MMERRPLKRLLLCLSFFAFFLVFIPGCSGNRPSPQLRAEINKKIMDSLKESGVGDSNNRNRYQDAQYRDGYDKGYPVGYREGLNDYKRGETYSPSMTRFGSGRAIYDEGYKRGYYDGYYDAFSESMFLEEIKQEPSSEKDAQEDKESGGYETGPEYQAGYEQGYKRGLETGRLDKKAGYGYLSEPSNYDLIGSEEYQRGFKDGYAKGYEEGYYGD